MHWLQAVVTQRPKLAGEKESQAGTVEKQLSYYEHYRNKFIYNFSIHSELTELATKRLNILFNKC